MDHRSTAAVLAVLLSAASGTAQGPTEAAAKAPAPAATAPAARPTVIGVVDFTNVIENYPKAQSGKARLFEMEKRIDQQYRLGEEKVREKQLARGNLKGLDRERATYEMEMMARQLEGLRNLDLAQLQEEENKWLIATYSEIETAIAEVAKNRGIDIVLRQQPQQDLPPKQKVQIFNSRVVWYASPEVDLTADVIKLLRVQVPEPAKAEDVKDAGVVKDQPKDEKK